MEEEGAEGVGFRPGGQDDLVRGEGCDGLRVGVRVAVGLGVGVSAGAGLGGGGRGGSASGSFPCGADLALPQDDARNDPDDGWVGPRPQVARPEPDQALPHIEQGRLPAPLHDIGTEAAEGAVQPREGRQLGVVPAQVAPKLGPVGRIGLGWVGGGRAGAATAGRRARRARRAGAAHCESVAGGGGGGGGGGLVGSIGGGGVGLSLCILIRRITATGIGCSE